MMRLRFILPGNALQVSTFFLQCIFMSSDTDNLLASTISSVAEIYWDVTICRLGEWFPKFPRNVLPSFSRVLQSDRN